MVSAFVHRLQLTHALGRNVYKDVGGLGGAGLSIAERLLLLEVFGGPTGKVPDLASLVRQKEVATLVEVLQLPHKEAMKYVSAQLGSDGRPLIHEGSVPGRRTGPSFWEIQKSNLDEFLRKRLAIQAILDTAGRSIGVAEGIHNFCLLLFSPNHLPQFPIGSSGDRAEDIETQLQRRDEMRRGLEQIVTFGDLMLLALRSLDPLRDVLTSEDLQEFLSGSH
jgi:hypothetical protein